MSRIRLLRMLAPIAWLALLAACGKDHSAVVVSSDPASAVATLARSLRENDLPHFYAQSLPQELRERTAAAYNAKRAALQPADAKEREEFAQTMTRLTAADAESALYTQIEPALVKLETEVAGQLPMMVAMGSGFASAAIAESKTLSADEKQHASAVLAAVAGWASTAPVADRAKARAAIAAVAASARALEIADLDTLRTLDIDAALAKAGLLWAGVKQITALYGLDIDAALDSVKAEALSSDNDNARVKISYTLLGKPVSFEMAMLRRDGQWYSADAIARAEAALQAPVADADADAETAPAVESDAAESVAAPGVAAESAAPSADAPAH